MPATVARREPISDGWELEPPEIPFVYEGDVDDDARLGASVADVRLVEDAELDAALEAYWQSLRQNILQAARDHADSDEVADSLVTAHRTGVALRDQRGLEPGVTVSRAAWTEDEPAAAEPAVMPSAEAASQPEPLEAAADAPTQGDLFAHLPPPTESEAERMHRVIPLRDVVRLGWIQPTHDQQEMARRVRQFLDVRSLDEVGSLAFAARKSDDYSGFSGQQLAWFARAQQLAKETTVADFDADRFRDAAPDLPRLSVDVDAVARIRDMLAELGVRLVTVPNLPQAYIDGGAFWLSDSDPVVAMSIRYNRIDYFWFTLMHELAHIHQNDRATRVEQHVVRDAGKQGKPDIEQRADALARDWLIPPAAIREFTFGRRFFPQHDIEQFAARIGVHPGIVVGRLQFDRLLPFSHMRKLLVEIRHLVMDPPPPPTG